MSITVAALTKLADRAGEAVKALLPDGVKYTIVLTSTAGEHVDIGLSSNATPGTTVDALEAGAIKIKEVFGLVEVTEPTPDRPS